MEPKGKKAPAPKKKGRPQKTLAKDRKLTQKQLLFCQYYAETGNIYKSAVKAGYKENTARTPSPTRLLTPPVLAEIERIKAKTTQKTEMGLQEIANIHKGIASVNIAAFFSDDWMEAKNASEIPKEYLIAVKSVSAKTDPKTGEKYVKFEFHDKQKSLDKLEEYARAAENIRARAAEKIEIVFTKANSQKTDES